MTEMDKQQQEILRQVEEKIEELKNIKNVLLKCQKDFECATVELEMVRKQNEKLLVSLKDCANELCQKCGQYVNDHLGSCDKCKWKNVKDWDVT